jgi:hypothetical protein
MNKHKCVSDGHQYKQYELRNAEDLLMIDDAIPQTRQVLLVLLLIRLHHCQQSCIQ